MPYSKKTALMKHKSGCASEAGVQVWSSSTRMMP